MSRYRIQLNVTVIWQFWGVSEFSSKSADISAQVVISPDFLLGGAVFATLRKHGVAAVRLRAASMSVLTAVLDGISMSLTLTPLEKALAYRAVEVAMAARSCAPVFGCEVSVQTEPVVFLTLLVVGLPGLLFPGLWCVMVVRRSRQNLWCLLVFLVVLTIFLTMWM